MDIAFAGHASIICWFCNVATGLSYFCSVAPYTLLIQIQITVESSKGRGFRLMP